MRKYNIIRFISIACLALLFSCSQESTVSETSQGKVPVSINLLLPEPKEVLTRAYTDEDIENITVLLFDEAQKFIERIDVEKADIITSAAGIKFNILVDATPNDRTFHLIANARTPDGVTDRIDFSGINTTKTIAEIIPTLTTKAITGTAESTLIDNISPLIMWGRVLLNGINVTTTVNDVKLLRVAACVRTRKGTASSANGLDNFTIHKMALFNGVDRGYVAPAAYTASVTANPTTGNPYTTSAFDYTISWSTGAEPVAYVYERNYSATDYKSVILYATYNSQAGYYKIALTNGDTPIHIVRNHRYTITIEAVNGPGYASAAVAVASAPSNAIKASIMDVDEEFPFIIADSEHWMGMSCNVFHLIGQTPSATQTTDIELCTVYSSRGVAPVPVVTTPASLSATVQTLSGNKYKIVGTFTHAGMGNNEVKVSCDNLSLTLSVKWNTIQSATGFNEDTDSYAFNAIESLQNWKMWIPDASAGSYIHLHASSSNASALTGNSGSGMATELTGKYGGGAYLHVHKGTNRKDEFWTSYSGTTVSVRKTVVVQ